MSLDGRNRHIIFYYPLFVIILLSYWSGANPVYSQAQPQNPFENKKVLILNAFEANVPAFEKTDHGLSVVLQFR